MSARRHRLTRSAGLVLAAAILLLAALFSLAVGARSIPLGDVVDALLHGGDSQDAAIVRSIRVPRTLLGLVVGAAIGIAGALMQALTRNPLADPGLLGINAGAAAAVITAIAFLGVTELRQQMWFALAGAALTAVLTAYANGVALQDQRSFDTMRFWVVGSVVSRELSVVA